MHKKIIFIGTIVILYVIIVNVVSFHYHTKKTFLKTFNNKRIEVIGEVIDFPKNTYNNRIFFIIKSKFIDKQKKSVKIKVALYNDISIPVTFGKIISFKSRIKIVKNHREFRKLGAFYFINDFSMGNYKIIGQGSFWRQWVQTGRQYLINQLVIIHSQEARRFIPALLFGAKNLLNKDEHQSMRAAGISHLLAVSGTHVGLLFSLVLIVFLKKRNVISFGLTITLSWIYVFLNGFSPSCTRAVIMLSFVLLAELLRRDYSSLYSLLWAGMFILVLKPYLVFNLGFQFSFLATFGIIYYYSFIYSILPKMPKRLKMVLTVTLSAQLSLAPVIVLYFQKIPVFSFINNILIMPLVTFLMWGSVTVFFISLISLSFAQYTAYINLLCVKALVKVLDLNSLFFEVYIYSDNISFFFLAVYYFYFLTIPKIKFLMENKKYKIIYFICTAFVWTGFIIQLIGE